ncbi:MAG: DUF2279 domain-containing protein [Bacteroidota bacterium]
MQRKAFLFLLCWLMLNAASQAQTDSLQFKNTINKKRLSGVLTTEAVLYSGSIAGLYTLWYQKYPQSSFHFFNDNQEWLYMDKMGHLATSYYIGKIGYESLKWAGLNNTKAAWYGGGLGFVYQTSIEVLDGFSKQWGFSLGDMTSNFLGSALFISQQLLWKEQKVMLKWSYSASKYAKYNPNLLGSNWKETWLKDYNGQTYWLSFNIHSILKENSAFPKWLNVAVGYGADGMIGASSNPADLPYFKRYSQWYLSADIDLTRITTRSKFLNLLFQTIGFIKIPLPTLEYNPVNNFSFHLLHF